mgnify:CR=1 FL=1
MTPAARLQTAIELFDAILAGQPTEPVLTRWGRRARYAGSGDRAAVRDLVFEALRRRRSAAARGGGGSGRAVLLGLLREAGTDPDSLFTGARHAPAPLTEDERAAGRAPEPGAEAGDLPDWLWPRFVVSLGAPGAAQTAAALRDRAPVMLRVNSRKADIRTAAQSLEQDGILVHLCDIAPTALTVTCGARRLRNAAAWRDGLVELQDGSGQAAVAALDLPPAGRVLDYCAGGGGKLLAMGARSDAALVAHDAAPGRMADLPGRAARAGLEVQRLDTAALPGQAPFDLVLCDLPCSGSGTWRRTPEAKWRLSPERLTDLGTLQRRILDHAATLVAPGGRLACMTCSVLTEENAALIDAFIAERPDWWLEWRRSWPVGPEGDGFGAAQLVWSGQ